MATENILVLVLFGPAFFGSLYVVLRMLYWHEIAAARLRTMRANEQELKDAYAEIESLKSPDPSHISIVPEVWWMEVCPTCGNKRCPHVDLTMKCTNSNATGQVGEPLGVNDVAQW